MIITRKFTDHVIGINVKCAYKGGAIVVSCERVEGVKPGDLLVSINDVAVADLGITEVSDLIKSFGRPLTICFYRLRLTIPSEVEELLTCPLRMDKGFKRSTIYAENENLIRLYLALKQISPIGLSDNDALIAFDHFGLTPPTSLDAIERETTVILQQYLNSEEGAAVIGYYSLISFLSSDDTDDTITFYYLYDDIDSARLDAMKAVVHRVTALSTKSHGPRSLTSILSNGDPQLSLALYHYNQHRVEKVRTMRRDGNVSFSAALVNPLGGLAVTKNETSTTSSTVAMSSLLPPSTPDQARRLVELAAFYPTAGRLEYFVRLGRTQRPFTVSEVKKAGEPEHTSTTAASSTSTSSAPSQGPPLGHGDGFGSALRGCAHIAVHRTPFSEPTASIPVVLGEEEHDHEHEDGILSSDDAVLEVAADPVHLAQLLLLLLAEEKLLLVHPPNDSASESTAKLLRFALRMVSANDCFSWQHIVFPKLPTLPTSFIDVRVSTGASTNTTTSDCEETNVVSTHMDGQGEVTQTSSYPPRLPVLSYRHFTAPGDYLKDLQNQGGLPSLSDINPGGPSHSLSERKAGKGEYRISDHIRRGRNGNSHAGVKSHGDEEEHKEAERDEEDEEDEVMTMLTMPFPYLCSCSLDMPNHLLHRRHHVFRRLRHALPDTWIWDVHSLGVLFPHNVGTQIAIPLALEERLALSFDRVLRPLYYGQTMRCTPPQDTPTDIQPPDSAEQKTDTEGKIEALLGVCRSFLALLCDHTTKYCFRVGDCLLFDEEAYIMETKTRLRDFLSESQELSQPNSHVDGDEIDFFLRRLISSQYWSVFLSKI